MNATQYQELAGRTLIERPDFQISDTQVMLSWNAIGLAGEAGEVCDLIKKGVYHQHGLDVEAIKKELGDVLWYIAALCSTLDLSLAEIMDINIAKLMKRYPDGYSSTASKARQEQDHV